jgi:hypothetical protein
MGVQLLEKDSRLMPRYLRDTSLGYLESMLFASRIHDFRLSLCERRYECLMIGKDLKYAVLPGQSHGSRLSVEEILSNPGDSEAESLRHAS